MPDRPDADRRLEIFAVGPDASLWHDWQTATSGWSGWQELRPGSVITSEPSVARATGHANGYLDVLARGTDSGLWHIVQPRKGDWTGATWAPLGGNLVTYP
jgi:hypothetical protein